MSISRKVILTRLRENGLPLRELPLQGSATMILPGFGGRALGPFFTPDSESILWVSSAFHDPDAFRRLVDEEWNMGGDRFWVGPEIQYLTRDRSDYWGSGFIPRDMDPGRWKVQPASDGSCHLSHTVTLEAFNLARGTKDLSIEMHLRPADNPLRTLGAYAGLMDGLVYAGYEQTVMLRELQADRILSALWNLVQVRPGGETYIPATPDAEVTDYMSPVEPELARRQSGGLCFQIDGRRQYKIGVKAAHTFGRVGYFHTLNSNYAYLIVRQFTNNPASEYMEEPPGMVGRRGDSIHIYNDNGDYGGFGELECHGQAIGGLVGQSDAWDRLELFIFAGPPKKLCPVGRILLGMEL